MTPTDPQGAEGWETRTEWRNVYRRMTPPHEYRSDHFMRKSDCAFDRRWMAEANPEYEWLYIEEVTTITQVTRHPLGGTERE